MKRRPFRISSPELKEEFPSGSDFVSVHDARIPQFAELRLTTGQGTSKDEIVLIAELWAGEGVLYDQKTQTEVAVWFDEGRLELKLMGCDIRSGSRFGERDAPDSAKTVELSKTETSSGINLAASSELGISRQSSPTVASDIGASAFHRSTAKTNTVTKRERGGTKSVVASGNGWQILRAQPISESSIARGGADLYKYITTEDRLCDLIIRPSARSARIEAALNVYPSALRYRVTTTGAIKKLKAKLTVNQDKIIQLLLSKGLGPMTNSGLKIAGATLRRKTTPRKNGSA